MTPYERAITPLAPDYDPRHVEAFMRVEHGTLDHLPPSRFRAEVKLACACIDEGGHDFADKVAASFGM